MLDMGHLGGSAFKSQSQFRSWSQGHEFKPYVGFCAGHEAYLKEKKVIHRLLTVVGGGERSLPLTPAIFKGQLYILYLYHISTVLTIFQVFISHMWLVAISQHSLKYVTISPSEEYRLSWDYSQNSISLTSDKHLKVWNRNNYLPN